MILDSMWVWHVLIYFAGVLTCPFIAFCLLWYMDWKQTDPTR